MRLLKINTPEALTRFRKQLHFLGVVGFVPPPNFACAVVEGTSTDFTVVQVYAQQNPSALDEPLAMYVRNRHGRMQPIEITPEMRHLASEVVAQEELRLADKELLGIHVAADNGVGVPLTARTHTKQFVTAGERSAFLAGLTYGAVMREAGYKLQRFEYTDPQGPNPVDVRPFHLHLHTDKL